MRGPLKAPSTTPVVNVHGRMNVCHVGFGAFGRSRPSMKIGGHPMANELRSLAIGRYGPAEAGHYGLEVDRDVESREAGLEHGRRPSPHHRRCHSKHLLERGAGVRV